MVAEEIILRLCNTSATRCTQLVERNTQHKDPPQWRPRDGRNGVIYDRFLDHLRDNMSKAGITDDAIDMPIPDLDTARITLHAATTKADSSLKLATRPTTDQLNRVLTALINEWATESSIIFDIVINCLLIDGPREASDRTAIRPLRAARTTSGEMYRDGRGLLKWALQWCNDSSYDMQTKLRKQLLHKLPANANLLQLQVHLETH